MGGYRGTQIEVVLELDDAIRQRIDRVIELGGGAFDRQSLILVALERALPGLEAQAVVFAARNVSLCPRCGESVLHNDIGDLRFTRCPACAGFWLDASTTEQLVAASVALPEIRELAERAAVCAQRAVDWSAEMPCPVCRAPLARRKFMLVSVVVDVCDGHGTWFDRGELSSFMLALEEHADERLGLGDAELAAEIAALTKLLRKQPAAAPAWP